MFLPLGDDNSHRRSTPIITYLIVAANAYVWWLQLQRGEPFTNGLSAVPYEITHGVDLAGTIRLPLEDGHSFPLRLYPGPHPLYLTIITSMFMHGSWMHILGNMLYLYIFGDQIEDLLGKVRYLLFYLTCGIVGSLAHIAGDPSSMIPSLGASGAIAGVLGAYLVRYPQNRVRVLVFRDIVFMPASIVLGGWIVLQFLGQAQSSAGGGDGVAYLAHIGGFLSGVILIFLLGGRR